MIKKIIILLFILPPLLKANTKILNLIINNNNISINDKNYLNNKIANLLDNKTIYRNVIDTIFISEKKLYLLTKNLPTAAKLINIIKNRQYEIDSIDGLRFYANDHSDLEGIIFHVYNSIDTTFFYAEGTAKFLLTKYKLFGLMYVEYKNIDTNKILFNARIYIYPNNSFARSLLKILLKLGFNSYVDKKISNIYNFINITAKAINQNPKKIINVIQTDSLIKKFKLNQNDIKIINKLIY